MPGFLFHCFQWRRRFRLISCKLSRDWLISYNEIIRWASRSCLQGYAFCDVPIMSQKGVVDKLKLCVDVNSLQLLVKQVYLLCGSCILQCTFHFRFIPAVHWPQQRSELHFQWWQRSWLPPLCQAKWFSYIWYKHWWCILENVQCSHQECGRRYAPPLLFSNRQDYMQCCVAMRVLGFINISPILLRRCEPLNAPTAGTGYSRPPIDRNQNQNHNLWQIQHGAWTSTICRSIVYFINLDIWIFSAQAWIGAWCSVANCSLLPFILSYVSSLETLKATMVSVDITSLALLKLHSCAEHASAPQWYLDIQRLVIMPVANPTSLTSLSMRRSFWN